jgi:hypothetical protein
LDFRCFWIFQKIYKKGGSKIGQQHKSLVIAKVFSRMIPDFKVKHVWLCEMRLKVDNATLVSHAHPIIARTML